MIMANNDGYTAHCKLCLRSVKNGKVVKTMEGGSVRVRFVCRPHNYESFFTFRPKKTEVKTEPKTTETKQKEKTEKTTKKAKAKKSKK